MQPTKANKQTNKTNAIQQNWFQFRGAVRKKNFGQTWDFVPTRGGGLTQSQLFIKIDQNLICLGTVHKCDETHST